MADVASGNLRLRSSDIGWPLEELWVTGDLLGAADSLDAGSVVVVLDEPPEEVPWLALNAAGEWVGEQLRLGKRPFTWCYRPLAWPVWNHRNRRLLRFWSASTGLDDQIIEALRTRTLDHLDTSEPTSGELVEQLRLELTISRRHLRDLLEHYWDHRWRGQHSGYDESPEDHLWRAAAAVTEIQDALDDLVL